MWLAGLLVSGFLSACGPPAESPFRYSVTWDVEPDPPAVGPVTIAISLADSSGQPVEGADVRVEGTMAHPGMQPAQSGAEETAPGRYETVLDFTMAGDWVLLLDATLPDGRTIHRQTEMRAISSE